MDASGGNIDILAGKNGAKTVMLELGISHFAAFFNSSPCNWFEPEMPKNNRT